MTATIPETDPPATRDAAVLLSLELELSETTVEASTPYDITHVSDGGWFGYDSTGDTFVLETSKNRMDLSTQVGRAILAGLNMMDRVLESKEALGRAPGNTYDYRDAHDRLVAVEADSLRTFYEALGYAAMLPSSYMELSELGRPALHRVMDDIVDFSHQLALREDAIRSNPHQTGLGQAA